jgi:hypothetical protein
MVQTSPGIITKAKRAGAWGCQIVEYLPSKHKILNSNPSTKKNKRRKERK